MRVKEKKSFSSQRKEFGEFLDKYKKKPLFVPNSFQRDYSWSKKEVTELLDDIIEAFEHNDFKYLHRIAITQDDSMETIIDGQQRITTLFLIYGRLINVIGRTFDEITLKSYDESSPKLRIRNSEDSNRNNKVLENILLKNLIAKDKNPLNKTTLVIDTYLSELDFSQNDFLKLYQFIEEKVFFDVDEIPSEFGKSFYDDINSKGLKMDRVDILKNYFNTLVKDEKLFSQLWMEFSNISYKLNEFGVYHRSHTIQELLLDFTLKSTTCKINDEYIQTLYESSSYSIRNVDLFIKKYFTTEVSAVSLLKEIKRVGDTVLFYLNDSTENSLHSSYNRYMIAHIPTLIIAKDFNVDVKRIYKLLDISLLTFRRTYTKYTNHFYKNINTMILNGFSIEEIEEWFYVEINSKYGDIIETLKDDCLRYKNKTSCKSLKLYLLYIEAHLENKLYNTDFYNNYKALAELTQNKITTIEHIIPKDDNDENHIHSIGNLTILTKTDNSRLRNKTEDKSTVYLSSNFILNKIMFDKPLFNNSFTKYISKYFTSYSDDDINNFSEEMVTLREKEVLNFIYKEFYRRK